MSLSECFRHNGQDKLADVVELFLEDSADDWTEQTPNVDHADPGVTDGSNDNDSDQVSLHQWRDQGWNS